MALAARSGQATASSFLRPLSRQSRCFSSVRLQRPQFPKPVVVKAALRRQQQQRYFSCSIRRLASEYVPPSSRPYLEGVAAASQSHLIDVKKVLVIGSGGISIGQAGEFDYSGR